MKNLVKILTLSLCLMHTTGLGYATFGGLVTNLLVPNNVHGKIMSNGDYVVNGKVIGNLNDYK